MEIANEELERLATSLALDLRSPLVSLHSISRIVQQDYAAQLPPPALKLFQLIHANAEEMNELTEGLLQLMRVTRQTVHKQELDPEEIVSSLAAELEREYAGRRVEITHGPCLHAAPTGCCSDSSGTTFYPMRLKFTRPANMRASRLAHARKEIGRSISSKDNGVGFDMAYAGTIFRAFQRYHHREEWGGSGGGVGDRGYHRPSPRRSRVGGKRGRSGRDVLLRDMRKRVNAVQHNAGLDVLAFALIAVTVAALTACQASHAGKTESLTIGSVPLESSALIYIAMDQQLFAGSGLDVTLKEYATGAAALNGLLQAKWTLRSRPNMPSSARRSTGTHYAPSRASTGQTISISSRVEIAALPVFRDSRGKRSAWSQRR